MDYGVANKVLSYFYFLIFIIVRNSNKKCELFVKLTWIDALCRHYGCLADIGIHIDGNSEQRGRAPKKCYPAV